MSKVLETWSGTSAEQFAAAAQKISKNFGKLAAFPHSTGHVLHQISERLTEAKGFVDSLEEPSMFDSIGDKIGDSRVRPAKAQQSEQPLVALELAPSSAAGVG